MTSASTTDIGIQVDTIDQMELPLDQSLVLSATIPNPEHEVCKIMTEQTPPTDLATTTDPRGRPHYTKAEKKLVKKMWLVGKTDKQIATALRKDGRVGCTAANVASLRSRERWLKRNPPAGSKAALKRTQVRRPDGTKKFVGGKKAPKVVKPQAEVQLPHPAIAPIQAVVPEPRTAHVKVEANGMVLDKDITASTAKALFAILLDSDG